VGDAASKIKFPFLISKIGCSSLVDHFPHFTSSDSSLKCHGLTLDLFGSLFVMCYIRMNKLRKKMNSHGLGLVGYFIYENRPLLSLFVLTQKNLALPTQYIEN
jgi:hypothetical protein